MALNDVQFNVVKGGLGRVVDGEDHISALVFDSTTKPVAYGSADIKLYTSIQDVEADGMTEGDATYGHVWYQASEFFRLAPGASLYIGFSAATFPEDYQQIASGKIRQYGAFWDTPANLATLQTAAETLDTLHAPAVIIAGKFGATAFDIATADDLGGETYENLAVLAAGDGGGKGAQLATDLGATFVPALGAVLGAVASASVHESVAWVQKFNLSDGSEYDTIRLADGTDTPTNSEIEAYDTKRYLTFRKHIGLNGTYLADSHLGVAATEDLAYIESQRTLQKAKRQIRARLLPQLNSPLEVNEDGTLTAGTVKYFESLTQRALDVLQNNGEISASGVFIDPAQDVLATSVLVISARIVPVGVARNITVNIGFAVSTQL